MKWGIWDQTGQCWMGNEKGPLEYGEKLHAKAGATIMNEMFGGRFRFRPVELPSAPFVHKDTVEAKIDGSEAIARICARATPNPKPDWPTNAPG